MSSTTYPTVRVGNRIRRRRPVDVGEVQAATKRFLDEVIGISPADIAAAREGWVLARALVPEGFDDYLANVENAVGDPEFLAVYLRAAEAMSWEPESTAARMSALVEAKLRAAGVRIPGQNPR